jgi:hypothetical protein
MKKLIDATYIFAGLVLLILLIVPGLIMALIDIARGVEDVQITT